MLGHGVRRSRGCGFWTIGAFSHIRASLRGSDDDGHE
jgi:hypothetical protein